MRKILLCILLLFFIPSGVFSEANSNLAEPILLNKAKLFDSMIEEDHLLNGMIVNIEKSNKSKQIRYSGDSTIWTGAYIASQVYRYKVTRDKKALENFQACLKAFVNLDNMSGNQGFLGRNFKEQSDNIPVNGYIKGFGDWKNYYFRADTSRDQYTGILMACAIAWPEINNPNLRDDVKKLIQNIANNLIQNNLSLKAVFSGKFHSFFDLNPNYAYQDRITRSEWNNVDDFPINHVRDFVDFSERLAKIVSSFSPPPLRGGEALRALMMIQTAANISENNLIKEYLQKELIQKRRLPEIASNSILLLNDLFYGKNLKVLRTKISGAFFALNELFLRVALSSLKTPESISSYIEPGFYPILYRYSNFYADLILNTFSFFQKKNSFTIFEALAKNLKSLKTVISGFCSKKLQQKLEKKINYFEKISGSNIDELADTLRSHVGTNLTFFALLGLFEQSTADEIKKSITAILPRAYEPISDEENSLYTFIVKAYSSKTVSKIELEKAINTLKNFPESRKNKLFNHKNSAKYPQSPWPDRFGKIGRRSTQVIPINERAPDIFIWQDSPRSIKTGANNSIQIAPVDYLLAYWFAREKNILSADD